MNFKFLHAADLHLGSPFSGLSLRDESVARRVAAASREAFSDLVSRAIAEQVAFVVVSGDVYDGDWKDNSIGLFFNREVARLHRASIPLYLLRGNHDAESVVSRTITLPSSVAEFSTRAPQTFRLDEHRVALHGRGFPDRAVTENWIPSYPDPEPGWFNIGVLHTSCDGRDGHHSYAPCTTAELCLKGYDSWALGHVHEYEELSRDPWVVFPGNLQGRSVRECGPKGAVLVAVDDGRVSEVRRLIVDRARWASVAFDVAGAEDHVALLESLEQRLRAVIEAAEGRLLALRVELKGETILHRRLAAAAVRMKDEIQAAAHRCHEDVWLEKVKLSTREPGSAGRRADVSAFDLGAMLSGLEDDQDLRDEISGILDEVIGKMPGETRLDKNELATFVDEARALVLGRIS